MKKYIVTYCYTHVFFEPDVEDEIDAKLRLKDIVQGLNASEFLPDCEVEVGTCEEEN